MCLASLIVVACSPAERVEGRGSDTKNWWDDLPRSEWSAFERVNAETPWFEIYKVRPNVYAIYEPNQFEEAISFLIVGELKALLFDTGSGVGDIKEVVENLTDKPITVLNSHGHYDHTGGNHQFENVIGVANAYAQSRAKGLPHSEVAEFVTEAWFRPGMMPADFSPEAFSIKPYKFDSFVMDGENIELGGRTLEVLFIPGHSPDSTALLDRANRQLYIGDTFYMAPLYAHLEGSNMAQYKETANRLAALAPDITDLMTAHNVPIVSADYLIDMKKAFDSIESGQTPYKMSDGAREYRFDGFSILAPDKKTKL